MAGLTMTIISKNTAFITKKINNNSRNRNNNYNDFNQMTKLYSSSINIDYFNKFFCTFNKINKKKNFRTITPGKI